MGISVRGEVRLVRRIRPAWEYESMGGRSASAARWSVASTPASSQNVALRTHDRIGLFGIAGPKVNAAGERRPRDCDCGAYYQSQPVTRPSYLVPRDSSLRNPPEMNEFTRIPPSLHPTGRGRLSLAFMNEIQSMSLMNESLSLSEIYRQGKVSVLDEESLGSEFEASEQF